MVELIKDADESFKSGKLNIKHAIIIYNLIMSFIYRLKDEQYEDYIYSFDGLTRLFSNVHEMLFSLRKLLSEKLESPHRVEDHKFMNYTFGLVFKYVNENFHKDISIQSLSEEFNLNGNYISQLFKKETGATFTNYLTKLRIDYACKLLKTTDLPISDIGLRVGYNDYFYFSRVFKKMKGKPPSSYRMDLL